MLEKIYSRRRIKIPKIKHKKISKTYAIFLIICISIAIAIISFVIVSYPIFVASCETAAGSKATNIVNDEVSKVMENYTYNDLIDIEKDSNGNVSLMKFNTVFINKITTKIISNIQKSIDNTPRIMVYINYGSVSGVSVLRNFGPKFDVELEAAGKINTEIKSEFESVNVNQTIHKLYMNLDTGINILTPIGVYGRNIKSKVLLTEAVVVGDVPQSYYNLEGLEPKESLEIVE